MSITFWVMASFPVDELAAGHGVGASVGVGLGVGGDVEEAVGVVGTALAAAELAPLRDPVGATAPPQAVLATTIEMAVIAKRIRIKQLLTDTAVLGRGPVCEAHRPVHMAESSPRGGWDPAPRLPKPHCTAKVRVQALAKEPALTAM